MILRGVALFHYFRIIYRWIMVMKGNGTKKNAKRQKVRSHSSALSTYQMGPANQCFWIATLNRIKVWILSVS